MTIEVHGVHLFHMYQTQSYDGESETKNSNMKQKVASGKYRIIAISKKGWPSPRVNIKSDAITKSLYTPNIQYGG